MAKLLPMHIRPPLPKAQNQRIISSRLALLHSSQRFGRHSSGFVKTFGLRCRLYALALTRTPPGNGEELASDVGVEGVTRGWGPGMEACNRSVSIRVACSRGSASRARGEGREGGVLTEG